MTLLVVVAVLGLAAAILMDCVIVPRLRQLVMEGGKQAADRAGTLGAAGFARSALLALVPAAAGVIAVLAWLDAAGGAGADVDQSRAAHAAVVGQVDRLPWPWFSALAAALVAIPTGAVFFLARSRAARARIEAVRQSRRTLEERRAAGLLEPLPPSDAMNAAMARVMECDEALRRAEDPAPGSAGRDRDTSRLRRWIAEALEEHRRLDIDRRVDDLLVVSAMLTPRPSSGLAHLQRFVVGPGLHDATSGVVRAVASLAALACIPVALVLLMHLSTAPVRRQLAALDTRIEDRRDREVLSESLAVARRDWDALTVPAGGPARLTDADRAIVARLARGYEIVVASSDLAAPSPATMGYARDRSERGAVYFQQEEVDDATSLERIVVRDSIMRLAASRGPSPRIRRPTLGELDGLEDGQRQTLAQVEQVLAADGPRSPVGRDFEAALIAALTARPQLWPAVRDNARAWLDVAPIAGITSDEKVVRFDAAVRSAGLSSMADVFADVEAARRYRTLAALASADSVGPWQPARESSAAEQGTVRYRRLVDLIAVVAPRPSSDPDAATEIVEMVVDRPPAVDVPLECESAAEHVRSAVDQLASRRAAAQLALEGDGESGAKKFLHDEAVALARAWRQADGLVQYEDFFPAQLRAESESVRGQLRDRLAALMQADPSASTADFSRTNLRRSRDFVSLRGFSRIGGVLIGRTDMQDAAADVRQLDWEFENGGIRLVGVDATGRRHESKQLPCDLVELALAYAADGRPTAVTMVTNESVPDLRILVHPTLVDTAVGRDAIELDRLVDVHTGGTEWRTNAEASVQRQVWLYRFAWAQRILALEPLWPLVGEAADTFRERARQLDATIRDEQEEFAGLLGDAALYADPGRCVLAAKPAYFDPQVVAWLRDGLPAVDLASLASAIRSRALATYEAEGETSFEMAAAYAAAHPDAAADLDRRIAAYNARLRTAPWQLPGWRAALSGEKEGDAAKPDTKEAIEAEIKNLELMQKGLIKMLQSCRFQPPEFVVWSGVRERRLAADGPLMPVADTDAKRSEDFDFILQVAFESAPYFIGGAPPASRQELRELEESSDTDPWQFPAIAERVQAAIEENLTDEERAVVDRMSDFARVQRFFRRGLDGGLGPRFPVVRLRRLAEALAQREQLAVVHTPRWNARPGMLERQCIESWIRFQVALAAAEPEEGRGAAEGPAIPAAIGRAMDDIGSLLRQQISRREAFETALADIDAGDRAARQAEADRLFVAFDRENATWEERLKGAAAELRTVAEAAEQPLFSAAAARVEVLAEQMGNRRRLGIQAEDRRQADRALGL